jgi:hypothetical protein
MFPATSAGVNVAAQQLDDHQLVQRHLEGDPHPLLSRLE